MRVIRLLTRSLAVVAAIAAALVIWQQHNGSLVQAQGQAAPDRPALTLILWGDSRFPYPDWRVAVDEQADRTSANWVNGFAVASRNIWHTLGNTPLTKLQEIANDDWIKAAFDAYADFKVEKRCEIDDHIIVHATGSFEGKTYLMRYWLYSNEAVMEDVRLVYGTDFTQLLEALSENIFTPKLARCA